MKLCKWSRLYSKNRGLLLAWSHGLFLHSGIRPMSISRAMQTFICSRLLGNSRLNLTALKVVCYYYKMLVFLLGIIMSNFKLGCFKNIFFFRRTFNHLMHNVSKWSDTSICCSIFKVRLTILECYVLKLNML